MIWKTLEEPRTTHETMGDSGRHGWTLGDVGADGPYPVHLETLGEVWRPLGDQGGPWVTLPDVSGPWETFGDVERCLGTLGDV